MSSHNPDLHLSQDDLSYIAAHQRHLSRSSHGPGGGSPRSSTSASSNSAATVNLDPRALSQLSAHFDGLLEGITARVESLSQQTLASTSAHHRRAQSVAEKAEAEIQRLHAIMRQCDELQNEFLKIRRIGEIVKGFRARVEALEGRVSR